MNENKKDNVWFYWSEMENALGFSIERLAKEDAGLGPDDGVAAIALTRKAAYDLAGWFMDNAPEEELDRLRQWRLFQMHVDELLFKEGTMVSQWG